MNIKKLKYFVVLEKCGNFNKAAEELCISQPALTRSIQSMEESLGLQLIDRSQRSIALTVFGQRLLLHANKTLLDFYNISRDLNRFKSVRTGSLTIGSGPIPANHIGALASAVFMRKYPEIQLKLVVDNVQLLIPKLKKGEYDVVLGDKRLLANDTSLNFAPMPRHPVIVIAREGHPLSMEQQVSTSALLKYPMSTFGEFDIRYIERYLGIDAQEYPNLLKFETNNIQLLLTTIRNTDAIGLIYSCNVDDQLKGSQISIIDYHNKKMQVNTQSMYGSITYTPRILTPATEAYIKIAHDCAFAGKEYIEKINNDGSE